MDINYKIIRSHKTHTNDLLAVRLGKNNKDAIGYFNHAQKDLVSNWCSRILKTIGTYS